MKILTTKLELRAEYGNRTGSRCKILKKEINRDNRKNLILVCEVTKSTTMAIGSIVLWYEKLRIKW